MTAIYRDRHALNTFFRAATSGIRYHRASMDIPSSWFRASGEARAPDGRTLPVSAWGWGEDPLTAKDRAGTRLRAIVERIARGERFPERYAYGSRPLREEILRRIDGAGQSAVITRNAYGVEVLNADSLLFLDIDLPGPGFMDRLRKLFGGATAEEAALAKLRSVLGQRTSESFRVYRTASGLRVMATSRSWEPGSAETKALMEATGTDPAYARLCQARIAAPRLR